MRLQLFILYLILSASYRGESQLIYFSSIEDFGLTNDSNYVRIGLFNILTCESSILYIDTIVHGDDPYFEWVDLALCPNGDLYGMTHDGIYKINISNREYIKIVEPSSPFRFFDAGLHCSKDSILYFGERDIASYDLKSSNFIYFVRLPSAKAI